MKLELDPQDLKPEHQRQGEEGVTQACSTNKVSFNYFTEEVQAAIRAAGRATFFAWDRKTYNAIYPPK